MLKGLYLVVHDPQLVQRLFPVAPGIARVGRQADCEIRLLHPSVSRLHAEFFWSDGSFSIRDLKSLNGTGVNSHRVNDPQQVKVGDRIRIGRVWCDVFGSEAGAIGLLNYVREDSTEKWDAAPPGCEKLSPAQREVFGYLLGEESEEVIAGILFLSRHTVHDHVKAIYAALGVHSRKELMALFVTDTTTFEFRRDFRLPLH